MVAAARCCRRASATMRWLDVGRTGAAASPASADDGGGPPSCGRGWDDLLEGVLVVVGARVAPAPVLLAADAAVEVEVPGAGPRREADADARVRPVMRGRATDGWTGRW